MRKKTSDPELDSDVAPKVTCEACLALPPSSLPPPRDRLITDAHAVQKWQRVIERTDVIHAIDAAGLVARYRLPKGQLVTCSFPDQRPHAIGRIGVPRCEMPSDMPPFLRIGRCCAIKRVSGIAEAVAGLGIAERDARRRSDLMTIPLTSLRRFAELQPVIKELNLFWPCDKQSQDAFARLSRAPASALEYMVPGKALVYVPGRGEELRLTAYIRSIAGIEFWRRRFTSTELEELEHTARRLRDIGQSRLSTSDLEQLHREALSLQKQTDAFDRWVGYGKQFFAPENLWRARELIAGVRTA
jgi:hypothetical protein